MRRSAEPGPRPSGSGRGAGEEDLAPWRTTVAQDRGACPLPLPGSGPDWSNRPKDETKLMNQLEEIFIEPGGKINLHKWHMIMKRKIEEDRVRDLKEMGYHSFLA